MLRQLLHRNLNIVADEIQFVGRLVIGGMHGHFNRRRFEDWPGLAGFAGINGWQFKNIAEKGLHLLRMF